MVQVYGIPRGRVANIPAAIAGGEQHKLAKDAISEQQKQQNTQWLAGAAKYGLENWGQEGILEQLVTEGQRRGILGPQLNAADLMRGGKGELMKVYRGAMTALGGPSSQEQPELPNEAKEYEYFKSLSKKEKDEYLLRKRSQPGLKIVKVPQPDGSERTMLWDSANGVGYDFGSGKPITPGPQGYTPPGQTETVTAPQQSPQTSIGVTRPPAVVQQETIDVQAAEDERLRLEETKRQRIETARSTIPAMANLGDVIQQAEKAVDHWIPATGKLGAAASGIPGYTSPYENLEATIETIAANEAFNRLQKMRDMSKTGGALGQVSERELKLLAGNFRSLSQSQDEDQFRQNLDAFKRQYQSAMRAWENFLVNEALTPAEFDEYWATLPKGIYLTPAGYKVKTE